MNTSRYGWAGAALATALLAASACSFAATPIPPGKWSFIFKDAKGHADRPVRVYTYRPRKCDSKCPIQIVMHGAKRDAGNSRDQWEFLADRYGLLIVAPELLAKDWPKAAAYNLGGVGEHGDPEKWAFALVDHLFDEVRDGQATYNIFGHSAGGQFVQRMALFRPEARFAVAMVGNAGWYAFPEWRPEKTEMRYPFALAGSKAGEAQVRAALAKRLVLVIGNNDSDPDEENLQKADGATKQGASRLDRGENFFKAATTLAAQLGIAFQWELLEVPDNLQDAAATGKAAANHLYKD